MAENEPITLKEVQLRLGVPQHVLIHLCEKGVIEPDFADTTGRGKRREFSQRNLFEFGVALSLRKFEIPVATTALVIRLLRSFARATKKLVPDFELPGFLLENDVELAFHIYDGDFLVFSARGGVLRKMVLLGVRIDPSREPSARPRIEKLDGLPPSFDARLDIDLSRIAQKTSRKPLRI